MKVRLHSFAERMDLIGRQGKPVVEKPKKFTEQVRRLGPKLKAVMAVLASGDAGNPGFSEAKKEAAKDAGVSVKSVENWLRKENLLRLSAGLLQTMRFAELELARQAASKKAKPKRNK
jgi:hypothetical protein